jgi:hypothetical protein
VMERGGGAGSVMWRLERRHIADDTQLRNPGLSEADSRSNLESARGDI